MKKVKPGTDFRMFQGSIENKEAENAPDSEI